MSKSTTTVSTSTIRTWVRENMDLSSVTDDDGKAVSTASILGKDGTGTVVRGRIAPFYVEKYLAANPTHRFGEGAAKPAERTVEVPRKGKNGRSLKPAVLPVSEARALAGDAAKGKGRLSSAALAAAGAALQAQETAAKSK